MSLRRVSEMVVPAVAVALALVLPVVWRDRLPDPLAIHWGLGGTPDGWGAWALDLALIAALTAVAGLVPLLAARRARARIAAQVMVAVGNGVAGLFAVLRVVTLRANLDVVSWAQARPVGFATVAPAFLVAAVLAAWGYWLAGDRPDDPSTRRDLVPVALAPTEEVVWSGGAIGTFAYATPAAIGLVAAIVWISAPRAALIPAAAVVVVLAIAVTTLTRLRMTIGPRGVRVRMGWLGWPRASVPLEQVTGVTWEHVEPLRYGGWGYRMLPGTRALVVRSGEGLRIERDGRATLVVTVDGAEQAGGVLLAHLQRRMPA